MNGEMTISITAENFKRFKELAGLNEKQSRLFFGLYSMNLGRGGPKKVAEHFGVGINPKISDFGAVDDEGKRSISLWHKQTPGIPGVDFYLERLYNILQP